MEPCPKTNLGGGSAADNGFCRVLRSLQHYLGKVTQGCGLRPYPGLYSLSPTGTKSLPPTRLRTFSGLCPLAVRSGFLGHRSPSVAKNATGPDRGVYPAFLEAACRRQNLDVCSVPLGTERAEQNGTKIGVFEGCAYNFCHFSPFRPKSRSLSHSESALGEAFSHHFRNR